MKTLYLHIGTPKTGTTAIQNFCKENAEILEKKGYCYPIFPFSYARVSKVRNGHFLVGNIVSETGKRDKSEENRIFAEGMQYLTEVLQEFDNVILSDESIWRSMDVERKELWKNLVAEAEKRQFKIQVIVYLRRQDQLITSHWNQMVKYRNGRFCQDTFEEYFEKQNPDLWLDYDAKIERIASTVGKENITVRRFEKGKFQGGNIYTDFLLAIGLSMTEDYLISQSVRNISLYGNTHEIKRILNRLPQIADNRNQDFLMARVLECAEISGKNYSSEMLSKDEIKELLKRYEEGNRKIAAEYFHDSDGELFDNTIEDVPKWEKNNPYMQDDLIRFIGTTSIYLFEENQNLKKELHEFEYKVRHPFRTLGNRVIRKFRPEKMEQ